LKLLGLLATIPRAVALDPRRTGLWESYTVLLEPQYGFLQ